MGVKRTTLQEIIGVLRQHFLDKGVIANGSQMIVVSKRKNPDHAKVKADILVRVGRTQGNPETDWSSAGGRWAFKKIRTIGIYVRTSSMVDKGLGDEQWLYTYDALEDKVFDAALCFDPLDADGNALLTETINFVSAMEPVKDQEDVWGEALVTFEIHYQLAGVDPTDLG